MSKVPMRLVNNTGLARSWKLEVDSRDLLQRANGHVLHGFHSRGALDICPSKCGARGAVADNLIVIIGNRKTEISKLADRRMVVIRTRNDIDVLLVLQRPLKDVRLKKAPSDLIELVPLWGYVRREIALLPGATRALVEGIVLTRTKVTSIPSGGVARGL